MWTVSLGNSTLRINQHSCDNSKSVPDVREAFDQGELMLDGPALRFGALLGSKSCQLVGGGMGTPDRIYLSICSGDAPCFKVICRDSSLARMTRLQLRGGTNVVHGRHLQNVCCRRYTEGSDKLWYDRYGVILKLSDVRSEE